jgi:urea transport system permease protein
MVSAPAPALPRAWRRSAAALPHAVVVIALLFFPFLTGEYQIGLVAKFLTFGLLALGLNLLWDRGGLLSFGHGAFFGLGAYGFALTLKHAAGVGATYLALGVGIAAGALFAAGLGALLLLGRDRVGGVYFGIVTLAVAAILQLLVVGQVQLTGGSNGLYGYATPALAAGLPLVGTITPYYVIAAVVIVVYYAVRALTRSTFGLALAAARQDERRAQSLGINTGLYQLVVFIASGAIAGLAGALYVPVGFVSPALFGLAFSTSAIVWVVVGGRSTLLGPLVGAVALSELQDALSGAFVSAWLLIVGLVLVGVVIVWPRGALGALESLAGLVRRRAVRA